METKQNWKGDEFHPTQQCFFCKKRDAVTHDHEVLYKVIRNTMGFPGYIANYTTARIPIPACSQCYAHHQEQGMQLRVLEVVAWIIATGVICYWMYDPGDGILICLILSMLIAVPLSFVPLLLLGLIWSLCAKKTDEVAGKRDYPVVKRLQAMGWQFRIPEAKYGKRKNENIDQDIMRDLNVKNLTQAKDLILDFLAWCRIKEGQGKADTGDHV